MPGVTPQGMDYHHSYGGMNGHGGGYGYGPGPSTTSRESEFGYSVRNGYGGPDMDQHSMDRFDNTRDMEPTIEMDHLATYSSKSGVMKPEDGLRKLRGMESTTGIWTMRCMMIIERKNLIIVDKGNGEELERFPLDLVHEPTAIFKEDKREVYTNLILFTILENPGKYNSRCDMHIFQSINAPSQEIVDEILAAKEGRPKLMSSGIPPPPMGPAPDPPGGHWLGGIKEPKSHFSYSTDALDDEEPKVGKREKIINLPGERHFFTDRSIPVGREHNRTPNPLVEEHFDREKYIPLGREETREKVITPMSQKHFVRQMHVPVVEEIRQKNAKSSIPAVDETFVRERYIPLEEMRQKAVPSVKENFVHERYTPHEETQEKTRNPHVKEHFVERRYIPNDRQRRSSLGSHSLTATSEGFPTSGIQEEEFDIPERYLSFTGRRSSSSGGRNRSSSVDRYTLPGSHGNSSLMSDVYAVPYDRRNSERYSVSSRERRASTGCYETPIYTEPRRLSTSSANIYEIPVKMERDSHQYRSEHDLQSALRRDRDSQYRSEHDLQSALRQDRDFFPENNTLSSSSRGKWRFGGKRQQYSSSNQGSSSGYSSMEPSVHYTTMPNPKSKSKQSSRFHLKTTTLRDEGIKTNTDGFRSQNEGFRVSQNEGLRPPMEGFRTPIDAFQVQNDGFRSQEVPIREKESVNSRGFYGQTQNRASYEASGGQNENLERDVQYLNSCFDDIEKFVARLQQAAEAYKELENRKRERQSHKKKNDSGPPPRDGMLNMRARPPPADDFIDIFQKIKWAFNLLAKLKAHIHDPNAPELVHFIFTPLSLIYEASRDPVHAGIDLASKAVSPLLTREAKELLLNCLTSKELELWQLLGRNWTTSEDETQTDQFKQTIDKAQLEQSLVNHRHQIEANVEDARIEVAMSQQMVRQLPTPRDVNPRHEEPFYARTRREDEPPYGRTRRDEPSFHTEPSGYARNIGSSYKPIMDEPPHREPMNPNANSGYQKTRPQENAEFKDDLRRKNAKIYEAVHERTGRNQKEITVEKGDILEVLDDSRNWWRLRNYKGESGYAPYTILRDIGDDSNDVDRNGGHRGSVGGYSGNIGHNQSNHIPAAPPPPRKEEDEFERVIKPIRHMRNDSDGRSDGSDRYRHGRRQEKRLGSSDRYINRDRTSDSSDGENFSGSLDGSIEDIAEMRSRNYRENDRRQNQNPNYRHSEEIRNTKNARGYDNRSFEDDPPEQQRTKSPPPPPKSVPPPPPPANRPPTGRKYNPPGTVERRGERDELHNELSQKLNGKPAVKSKPQHRNLYLSTKSSAYEVTEWLRSKSFSERCINQLSGYNGYDLLRMKTKDIERLIGQDEAKRLTGHLTLQKNISGYKTQGPRELQAILQQRKQKADTLEDDDVGRPPSFAPDSPDYSDDNSEASAEDFGNAGKTLRALLQHQRKKINSYRYEQ